ncbi:hypothetical protein L210DRAFT_3649505 [Boletus edulis BED1]|uniref:Protein kinase domain-containing protein n=1 Tax=Boletus edulis BED1 TaxID=1328754 RepID=A0AAD4BKL0_BOLED|nr:hypothetical protein L210DRAFT_3649505 [Boletus edulis BED1]
MDLRYGHLTPAFIKVPPDTTVDHCKELILRVSKSKSPRFLADLYRVPEEHAVNVTLGAVSISNLGPSLVIYLTMQDIFGLCPQRDHLHLVLVDLGVPLTVRFWIPSIRRFLPVDAKENESVYSFLPLIKEVDPTLKGAVDFAFYKTPYIKREQLLDTTTKDQPLHNLSELFSAFNDIPFSKFPCVTVEAVRPKRKHELSLENAAECTKRQKFTAVAPSSIGDSYYRSVQCQSRERIFDYRRPTGYTGELPEAHLPPIEVLFGGFGRFLEIWRAASATHFKPDSGTLHIHIDEFVTAMSRVYVDELERRTETLAILNKIFPQKDSRQAIVPAEIPRPGGSRACVGSPARTDGLSCYRDIPCILVELKNEGPTKAIAIAELVPCYKLLVAFAMRNQWRLMGPTITFFALASVLSPVYVPLTTGLWCLPIECGGSDRYQLYAAFKAATVLLECIDEEAKRISDGPGVPAFIERPMLPQLNRLRRYHDSLSPPPTGDSSSSQYIEFQMKEFIAKDVKRHVYLASSSSGDLVVKLTRSYSPELHAFCARFGHAPKLYAYERLAGGIIAVAMEYVNGEMLAPTSDPTLQVKWITTLQSIVGNMHENEFVHGDLRPPNIMVVKDEVMLLDFDWGGKVGEARYPPVRLHPQLEEGRSMSSVDITKEDDDRVLKGTINYIRGGDFIDRLLRRAYLSRSKACHPEFVSLLSFILIHPSTHAFQKVSIARGVLSQPSPKRVYDASPNGDQPDFLRSPPCGYADENPQRHAPQYRQRLSGS